MPVHEHLDRPIGAHLDTDTLPEWALGPFTRDTEPVLETTNRGWESGRIFNMSVIEENGKLILFYRATRDERIDQDSCIGLAWSEDGEHFHRHDENPIIEPTESYEHRGTEDPKIYKYDNMYFLFYNPIWESEGIWSERGAITCNIALATSKDLIHWEKRGQLVPASLSGGWAKGAVIPHNPRGEPVKVDGEFLMYVGELATDDQLIGRSDDMVHWKFEKTMFLEAMPDRGVKRIHEPATMLTDIPGRENDMILTFNYVPSNELRPNLQLENLDGRVTSPAGQVLYSKDKPTDAIDFAPEPAGSWGGIIEYDGEWLVPEQECACFAQAPIDR